MWFFVKSYRRVFDKQLCEAAPQENRMKSRDGETGIKGAFNKNVNVNITEPQNYNGL